MNENNQKIPGPDEMHCTSCGSIISKDALFCKTCGIPIKSQVEEIRQS